MAARKAVDWTFPVTFQTAFRDVRTQNAEKEYFTERFVEEALAKVEVRDAVPETRRRLRNRDDGRENRELNAVDQFEIARKGEPRRY
jgi:hypothetical protein